MRPELQLDLSCICRLDLQSHLSNGLHLCLRPHCPTTPSQVCNVGRGDRAVFCWGIGQIVVCGLLTMAFAGSVGLRSQIGLAYGPLYHAQPAA